jgi:hypothetical protein
VCRPNPGCADRLGQIESNPRHMLFAAVVPLLGVLPHTRAATEKVPLNLIEVILAQGSWFATPCAGRVPRR